MVESREYLERVYAGVLGKIIGVYLGRPFEGWRTERILAELGEIWYYVHEQRGVPLVVTDDDISGTFTFLRALPDYGCSPDLTPEQIGRTWLNYIIENRSILWWGGMGHSTEHTAFVRLKAGVPAPRSGSTELNGAIVAEQIGAQIFIDGWGMIFPGEPDRAADFARRAASVSHDGEAIYGAQVVAAMEALAFVESDLNRLLDAAVALIPPDSVIARLIRDLRGWHAEAPDDWRGTRERLEASYGYHLFGGNCHMVPNHALIIHALLHGGGDFQKSLMIVNTCGWDTDCNSGNVGCLLGIRGGLAALEAGPDWRGPVADRLFLPTADGGRAISDAATEAFHIVNTARGVCGLPEEHPKDGARFHFSLPGSVQGFREEDSPECRGVTAVEQEGGPDGAGRLAIRCRRLAAGRAARVATATFIPPETRAMKGYSLIASPTLYPGQTVQARLAIDGEGADAVQCRLYLRHYDSEDALHRVAGPALHAGTGGTLTWRIPETGGQPIAEIGVEALSWSRFDGTVYLERLGWSGVPETELRRPEAGSMWRRAWVDGADRADAPPGCLLRVIQDRGVGLQIQGTREWRDYSAEAWVRPHLCEAAGLAVRVQGLRRYVALLVGSDGAVRLVRDLDGAQVLAEVALGWEREIERRVRLEAVGARIRAWVDDRLVADVLDAAHRLDGGAVALVCAEGRAEFGPVRVSPASASEGAA